MRSGDISESFSEERLLRSSSEEEAFFLKRNDILISSIGQGSIGKVQLFRENGRFATVSEVTVVRVKNVSPAIVAAFLSGWYGQSQISRYVTGATGQLHLYPNDVGRIFIPEFSNDFQLKIDDLYERQIFETRAGKSAQIVAQQDLIRHLGLAGWAPPEPLTYSAKASDALAAGRLDAQYFRPLFQDVEQRLQETGRAIALSDILAVNSRGRQPIYAETGLPVVNSKHVRTNRVILDDNRTATKTGSPVQIRNGDVLMNGTGVGTIGRTAVYLHDEPSLPDNHVTVMRTDKIDPVFLSVFLNSPLGQWQIERHIKGSSGQIELYPQDIARIVVWDAPNDVQQSVRSSVLSAFDAEHRAKSLLDAAKRAVEIAIEDSEAAAMAYLATVEGAN